MTGKELADHYRGTKAEILRLYKAACAEVDERAGEHAKVGMAGKGEADADMLVGRFCHDIAPQREELGHTMAVSDLPVALAIGGTIAAICAACAFSLSERAKSEGATTDGRCLGLQAQGELHQAAELLLSGLDRVPEVA